MGVPHREYRSAHTHGRHPPRPGCSPPRGRLTHSLTSAVRRSRRGRTRSGAPVRISRVATRRAARHACAARDTRRRARAAGRAPTPRVAAAPGPPRRREPSAAPASDGARFHRDLRQRPGRGHPVAREEHGVPVVMAGRSRQVVPPGEVEGAGAAVRHHPAVPDGSGRAVREREVEQRLEAAGVRGRTRRDGRASAPGRAPAPRARGSGRRRCSAPPSRTVEVRDDERVAAAGLQREVDADRVAAGPAPGRDCRAARRRRTCRPRRSSASPESRHALPSRNSTPSCRAGPTSGSTSALQPPIRNRTEGGGLASRLVRSQTNTAETRPGRRGRSRHQRARTATRPCAPRRGSRPTRGTTRRPARGGRAA